MKTSGMRVLMGVTAIGLLASMSFAINIETVTVGNAGNAADPPGDGYGAVGYTYNIGKYEVTAGQYTEFLNAVAMLDTYGLYNMNMWSNTYGCKIERYVVNGTFGNWYQYRVASDYANRPVNYVSYWDSCRFANWLHNGQPTGLQNAITTEDGVYTLDGYNGNNGPTIHRNGGWRWAITSEDEWYKAAYHKNDGVTGNYWDYPTRSDIAPGRDLNDISGNNANHYGVPFPIQSPYYTTVAGEFQNSDSPYGTFDQSGNVCEWNEAIVYQDATSAARGMRGGSFNYGGSGMPGDYPTVECEYLGFRVVQTPVPVVITFSINNMASFTTSRTVTLNNSFTNSPTDYMASESSTFTGATWETYSISPTFYLSAGNGIKTVYLMTKNSYGWSLVVSDIIVSQSECNRPLMDINDDQHVDAIDFDTFSNCYNGPTNLVGVECFCLDSDGDQYVDAIDFDVFSACYNGPTNPPRCY